MAVVFRLWIPDGIAGTDRTVTVMQDLVESGKRSAIIRDLAVDIIRRAGVESLDCHGELSSLVSWVRRNIRFVKDPCGVEYVQSPQRLLRSRAGDCDDIATLLAALSESIGHDSEFVVTSDSFFGPMTHVYSRVAGVGSMDTSNRAPAGRLIPEVGKSKVYRRD